MKNLQFSCTELRACNLSRTTEFYKISKLQNQTSTSYLSTNKVKNKHDKEFSFPLQRSSSTIRLVYFISDTKH